jgi:hypothetical protein
MIPVNKSSYIILFIMLVGFLLRVWGLDFGLPHQFHQDEPIVVNHALTYGVGDLNPRFFAIPPLTSYVLFAIYGLMFLIGLILGAWQNTYDFAMFFFRDPTLFYVVGRFFIGVVPGIMAIFLVYRLSIKFISQRASLYAAAIMALSFLNVVNSKYIYTDMILTVLILIAYVRLYLQYISPSVKNYCLTGLFIGLATGAKYNGVLLVVPYFLAHFLSGKTFSIRTVFSGKLWLGPLFSGAGFILVNPFAVLDFPTFMASSLQQSGAFWHTGWTHHITYSLFEGISLPLTVLGISGIIIFVFSRDNWLKVFVSFPVSLYLVLVFRSQHFARYVIFLVPFLSIGAGYLIFDRFLGPVKRYRLEGVVLFTALMLLVPTLVKAVKADMLFSSRDTRVIMADWIRENVPEGSKIACDSTFFRPAMDQPYSQLVEKREYLDRIGVGNEAVDKKLKYVMALADKEREGYPLYFLYEDPVSQGKFLNTLPAVPYHFDVLREEGIEYVVINGQTLYPAKERFLSELALRGNIVKEIGPYGDRAFRFSSDPIATTCIPVSGDEIFRRDLQGPSLRMYRLSPQK